MAGDAHQPESGRSLGWDPAGGGIQLGPFFIIRRIPAGRQPGSTQPQSGDPDQIPSQDPAIVELVVYLRWDRVCLAFPAHCSTFEDRFPHPVLLPDDSPSSPMGDGVVQCCTTVHPLHGSWGCTTLYNCLWAPWVMRPMITLEKYIID